jgi:hypothetical protein
VSDTYADVYSDLYGGGVTYYFRGLTVDQAWWPTGHPLIDRIRSKRGRSLIKENGVYSWVNVVTYGRADAAEAFYEGGRTYVLSDAEYADLVAAGYSDYLAVLSDGETLGLPGYGFGEYGVEGYGA